MRLSAPINVQPPAGTLLDFADPINTGVLAYWPCSEGGGNVVYDHARKRRGVFTNGPTWSTGKAGRGVVFDGTATAITFTSTSFTAFTAAIWFKGSEYTTNTRWLYSNTGDVQVVFGFVPGISTTAIFWRSQAAGLLTFNCPTPALNLWHLAVVTRDGANNVRAYVDGVESTSGAQSDSAAWVIDSIGTYPTGTQGWLGTLSNARLWTRALKQQEITRLYVDYFAGFVWSRRRIISSGAGGTSYASSLTETGTAADTIGGALALGGSEGETGTAADTVAGALVLPGSEGETGTAADTVAGALALAAAMAETGLASADSTGAALALVASLSESASASDDLGSGQGAQSGGMTETGSLADTIAASLVLSASLAQTATLADAIAAALQLVASLVESGTLADTVGNGLSLAPPPAVVLVVAGQYRVLVAPAQSRVLYAGPNR